MQEALENLKTFVSTYTESDYLQKCRDIFMQKSGQLNNQEKIAFLDFLTNRGGDAAFLVFCEVAHPILELEQAKSYSLTLCEKVKNTMRFKAYQCRIGDFFMNVPKYIGSKDKKAYLLFAIELSIKYDCICALQRLFLEDRENRFIDCSFDKYESLVVNQPDRRIGDTVQSYFLKGEVSEDWQQACNGYEYVPDIYVDYFATKGNEICKENLKSYKKSKLLSAKTTLEELNAFIDIYNWDDGVEVPYFIMHHKNCNLALRKRLFELGAGDCIDEKTYIDTERDPWKKFILELKGMIEQEEQ